jgi:hypothetical protein
MVQQLLEMLNVITTAEEMQDRNVVAPSETQCMILAKNQFANWVWRDPEAGNKFWTRKSRPHQLKVLLTLLYFEEDFVTQRTPGDLVQLINETVTSKLTSASQHKSVV